MISLEAIVAVKALVCLGFALWLLVSVVNHFTDWSGAVTAVGGFMRMASFDQEPKIPSPLTRRRIQSRAVHVTTFAVIVAIQAIDALLLAVAGLSFLAGSAIAVLLSVWGFLLFTAVWFAFLIAGSWFGYWVRLGDLQRTHLLLLAIGMLALVMMVPR